MVQRGADANAEEHDTGNGVVDNAIVELSARRKLAQEERIRADRAAVCDIRSSDSNSAALQMQRPRSRMS